MYFEYKCFQVVVLVQFYHINLVFGRFLRK